MIRLAANITLMFTEVPFVYRVREAAAAGFMAVECQFPYGDSMNALVEGLRNSEMDVAVFNAPPGDWTGGDRGLAGIPSRQGDFEESLAEARETAARLHCRRVHILAGNVTAGANLETLVDNLTLAVDFLKTAGVGVLVEPLNPVDFPGYLVSSLRVARTIAAKVPELQLQADLYHFAMMGLDPVATLTSLRGSVGHVQIAGPPARAEPTADLLDVAGVVRTLESWNYQGFIGCEYRPRRGTKEGLGWAARWLSCS